jgi:hypothetical protein
VVAPGIDNCQGRSTRPATIAIIRLDASSWNVAAASGGEFDNLRRA